MQLGCFVGIICAIVCGVVASQKGRSVPLWVILGLLFGIIPLIIVACLPNVAEQQARDNYISEENRRLREQLRQERIKAESFRQHASARLDAHDQHLGLDTRTAGPAIGAGEAPAGQLASGNTSGFGDSGGMETQWYYGKGGKTVGPVKANEIADLIRLQIITRETLLWSEQMSDWQPAGVVRDFEMHFV